MQRVSVVGSSGSGKTTVAGTIAEKLGNPISSLTACFIFTKWAPEDNIIRWAWTRFDHTREKYEGRMNSSQWSDLDSSVSARAGT